MNHEQPLTPKQEAFVHAYIETGNASEAYRQAYNAARMKPAVIHVKASELLASGKVAVRIAELQAAQVERHQDTVETIADMLKADRTLARECMTLGPAVSAAMGLAKLRGFLTDKLAIKDERAPALSDISDEEAANMLVDRMLEAFAERQAAQAKAAAKSAQTQH